MTIPSKLRSFSAAIAVAVLASTSIDAQQVGAGGSTTSKTGISASKERIRKDVLEKRRQLREGRIVRTSVRVTVRLQNGFRMRGVVKNGRFIERVSGLEFVPADVVTPGAGLRLWYYDGSDSYIFLPHAQIAHHKIGERLTAEDIRALEEQLRKKAREKAAQAKAKAAANGKPKAGADEGDTGATPPTPPLPGGATRPGGGTSGDGDAAGTGPKLSREQLALLTEFPPDKGWGPEKVREIEHRKITVGVFPDEKSRRFLEVYEEWNLAHEAWQQVEATRAASKKTGSSTVNRGQPAAKPPGGSPPSPSK